MEADAAMLDSLSQKLVPPSYCSQFGKNYWGPSDLPVSPLFVRAASLPPRKPKTKIFDIEYEPETKPSRKYIEAVDDVAYKPYKPRVFSRAHRPKVVVYSEIFEPMYKSSVLGKRPRYDYEVDAEIIKPRRAEIIKPRRAVSACSLPLPASRLYPKHHPRGYSYDDLSPPRSNLNYVPHHSPVYPYEEITPLRSNLSYVKPYSPVYLYEETIPLRSNRSYVKPYSPVYQYEEVLPPRSNLSYLKHDPHLYPYEEVIPTRSRMDEYEYDVVPRQRRRVFTHRYPVRVGVQV